MLAPPLRVLNTNAAHDAVEDAGLHRALIGADDDVVVRRRRC